MPPCNDEILHCVRAHVISMSHCSLLICVHSCLPVLLRIPSYSVTRCLDSYFCPFWLVWKIMWSLERKPSMHEVCVSKCLSVFVHILFFFVGHGCFINSCLRILACALGGRNRFVLSAVELATHGRAWDNTSIVYVYTYYIQIWQPFKSIGR